MSTAPFDPTNGTTPVTFPSQDACCQSPCDPAWRPGPSCIAFTETKTIEVPFTPSHTDAGRVFVTVSVTYTHSLCLVGKQHGSLAYTLTLLPGEKFTLYHSDRYRRVTSESERFSVQTTFSQFVSALYQQQNSKDSTALNQVLNNQTSNWNASGSAGVSLFGLVSIGGGGGGGGTSSSSSLSSLSTQSAASQFYSTAQQAAQYTDLQRSITVSSYEDTQTVNTTQRTLVNNNVCYAVTYFVRRVLDVYVLTTKVTAVTFRVTAANYVSPLLTPAEIGQVPPQFRPEVEAILKALPAVGDGAPQVTISVPTDGVVYDPELAHCCVRDPELVQADRIKLERDQAEAQKIGLELQLMALEAQRRQALLAAGTLTPFEVPPATTVVA